MTIPYTPPKADAKEFNCPACNAYAHFHWSPIMVQLGGFQQGQSTSLPHKTAQCAACKQWTLWAYWEIKGEGNARTGGWRLVHPKQVEAPMAHPTMPGACKVDYDEARLVKVNSPRAAAALLRLCVERLCQDLNAKGGTLNEMIGDLVKRGLDPEVQRALDVVRVTGGNSIHPGTMSPTDDPEVVEALFVLVNEIVQEMLAKPARIQALYDKLPAGARAQIERRDKKTE